MRKSDIALEKKWVTQSGSFRLATTLVFSMGIPDGMLQFCHGISEESVDKTISTKEYNSRTVYKWFNDPFTDNFGIPALNLPPITIDDRPRQHKRACYAPDLFPAAIYIASDNSVSTFTTPSDSPQIFILPSDDTNPIHVMRKDGTYRSRLKRGYWCRNHDK